MLNLLINIININLAIACYNLVYYYILFDNNEIYKNYNQLKLLINTNIKLVLHKELLFRIYLVELMKLFMNDEYIIIMWVVIYSTFNVYYHYNINNIIKTSYFIYNIIIAYYLINSSILGSLFIHCYSEFMTLYIQKCLSKFFGNNNINNEKVIHIKKISETINTILSSKLEVASKEEVEKLLSNKKLH